MTATVQGTFMGEGTTACNRQLLLFMGRSASLGECFAALSAQITEATDPRVSSSCKHSQPLVYDGQAVSQIYLAPLTGS